MEIGPGGLKTFFFFKMFIPVTIINKSSYVKKVLKGRQDKEDGISYKTVFLFKDLTCFGV